MKTRKGSKDYYYYYFWSSCIDQIGPKRGAKGFAELFSQYCIVNTGQKK